MKILKGLVVWGLWLGLNMSLAYSIPHGQTFVWAWVVFFFISFFITLGIAMSWSQCADSTEGLHGSDGRVGSFGYSAVEGIKFLLLWLTSLIAPMGFLFGVMAIIGGTFSLGVVALTVSGGFLYFCRRYKIGIFS